MELSISSGRLLTVRARRGHCGPFVSVFVALAVVGCVAPLSSVQPSAQPSPSLSPPGASGVAHFDADGLAFDYPVGWRLMPSGLNEHYITILDFLGTGSGSAGCVQVTPGPSDTFISGSTCQTTISLGPGQVVVELESSDGPPRPAPIDRADPVFLDQGGRFVTVGGLPAVAGEESGHPWGADVALTWMLSVPARLIDRYFISAYIKGPDTDALRAQVDALIASIAYDPPVPVLDPANGRQMLAMGLNQEKEHDSSFACFPLVPGTSDRATVTELPGYSPLHKPLPVTCTSAIAPEPIGLWRVTLTEAWTAAPDRSAGSLVTTMWLSPDGTPGETGGGPAPSEIPYWP